MAKVPFTITRINNASILIGIGEHFIFTDPYFIDVPFIGVLEPAAIAVKDLPPLTAILGCHDVVDHWQMDGLVDYPHNKDDVRLFVAMESQAESAREAGFKQVEVLSWGHKRVLAGGLIIESVQAQKMLKWTVNNYVVRLQDTAIFFGSEARDLPPLVEYKKQHGAVDIAILPVNGVHLMTFYQLVMTADEAVEGTKLLGDKTLFAIHDAHKSWPLLLPVKSSGRDAEKASKRYQDINVVRIPTGQLWQFSDGLGE
ncbi:MBL fold metallo-hydrolase [Endozoicomonas sp. G2_1]|uniref:MBL fold metallo-hydrolase n=1 Tax=Endozoicomonas sp. G2_1 TaxID=2821091 RepID=UPI001ADA7D5F|nr:MBL fold metallo-hydrolase [Endozoicomonas sp. G2_1]MBO9491633.1 MBL fold metallo-hydrolase [Endozoicomonas sp. G2_1]